jgi:hypothetical protein
MRAPRVFEVASWLSAWAASDISSHDDVLSGSIAPVFPFLINNMMQFLHIRRFPAVLP